MMKASGLWKKACVIYAVVAVLFTAFFVYVNRFEHASKQETRSPEECRVVENYTEKEIADSSAPIGIRREYRWILSDTGEGDSALVFYIVHHYAEVYIGDELMYSLMPDDTNPVGKSVGSNWVSIPLYPDDSGKEIRIITTPIYESVRHRQVVFQIGSPLSLCKIQLEKDFPQLVLSVICCLLGVLIMAAQLVLIWREKSQNWSVFFVGNVTAFLGIWKLTDTRFSSILFKDHAVLISYLSIGAVFLGGIAATLFLSKGFSENERDDKSEFGLMLVVSLIASGVSLAALCLQIFGIADFRQTLPMAHMVIIIIAVLLAVVLVIQKKKGKRILKRRDWVWAGLLVLGAMADMIVFYVTKTSANLYFTLLAVPVATVLMFFGNLSDANRRACTDYLSGLFNKSRWESLMDNPAIVDKNIGIIMFDLNRLKYVNDTMGHEAGDKLILNFVNILRNTIPPSETICRWGGDEFTVLVTDASHEKMAYYLKKIHDAADAYNESGQTPELYFAAGYALSEEFPDLTPSELLRKADERMYLDKHRWYSENDIEHRRRS